MLGWGTKVEESLSTLFIKSSAMFTEKLRYSE